MAIIVSIRPPAKKTYIAQVVVYVYELREEPRKVALLGDGPDVDG
jgi:hypothetical protein